MPALSTLLPWLREVDRTTLKADLGAGLLGAVLALPQGVAFATLAGLPPQYGVYGAVVPCIVAALAGSSRHVVTGPTNANSLALLAALSPLALAGSGPYIDLALAVTLLVGLLQLTVGALRLGAVANFISPSVLLGFMSGAAVLIGLYSLKDLLGLSPPLGTSAFGVLGYVVAHPLAIHWPSLVIGVVTLVATLLLRRLRPRWPTMLLGLLAGCLSAWILERSVAGAAQGIATVGRIPSALPPFHLPNVTLQDLGNLSGIAVALTLVALGQSLSIAKAVAQRSGQRLDVNREFRGQGLANLVGGCFSAYVSCGSLNRSMPNFEAGARTPLAAVFAALLVVALVAFGGALIAAIPLAAIAATLLLVARGLLDLGRWREVLRVSRTEALVAGVTLLATLTIPLDRAVLLGTLVSLVAYLYRTSHPAIRPLVPDPRTPERRFTPLDELGQPAQECPQLKLVRVEGSVFFGAVPHVGDQLDGFRSAQPGQKHALFMTKSMNFIDLAGNDLWRREWRERRAQGGDLYFHRPRTPVLQLFAKTGFLKELGDGHIFSSKDQALRSIYPRLDPGVCRSCTARTFVECAARAAEQAPGADATRADC